MKQIVAVDLNWGIGRDNDMLISIPDDMKFFVEQTRGKTVIMGKNTLFSLPGAKPLKNRRNIVISSSLEDRDDLIIVRSIDELLEEVKKYPSDELMVIGGASIYKKLLDYSSECIVTKIEKSFSDVHVYFPNLDQRKLGNGRKKWNSWVGRNKILFY